MSSLLLIIAISSSIHLFAVGKPRMYPTSEKIRSYFEGRDPIKHSGLAGYKYIAKQMFHGNLHEAYSRVSKALTKEEFAELGFGPAYYGTVMDYSNDLALLIVDGKVNPVFGGTQGYLKFAKTKKNVQMKTVHKNMSALLTKQQKKELNWGAAFNGSITEFKQMYNFIFKSGADVAINKWFGKNDGLTKLVRSYLRKYNPKLAMQEKIIIATRHKFRSVVSYTELRALGWDTKQAIKGRYSCSGLLE